MEYSDAIKRLHGKGTFGVLAKAKALERKGKKIIHLEIGQPDFDTPQNVKDAGIEAIQQGRTKYVQAEGIPELRAVAARYIENTRNIPVDPDEIVIAPGVKPILFFAMLACAGSGDEVMYPNPGFYSYEALIRFVGAKPIPIPLLEEKNFTMDISEMKRRLTSKTRLIIVNSPHNPTGGVVTEEDLGEIARMATERDLTVLSDEVYSRFIYDGEFKSIASLPGMKERTVVADGFSKTYAMTGWRLGFAAVNRQLVDYMTKLTINSFSCTPMFTQLAGIEALLGSQDAVDEMLEAYRRRRNLLVDGLNNLKGFRCMLPAGAFYAFPNHKALGVQSEELADIFLNEAGVACLPGSAFGEYGEGYLRFSYASSEENISRALELLAGTLKKL
jgi:aspartate/methionine/tyrosine aminotransferase